MGAFSACRSSWLCAVHADRFSWGMRFGWLFVFPSPHDCLELDGAETTAHEEEVPLTGGAVGLHQGTDATLTQEFAQAVKPETASIHHDASASLCPSDNYLLNTHVLVMASHHPSQRGCAQASDLET